MCEEEELAGIGERQVERQGSGSRFSFAMVQAQRGLTQCGVCK